MVQIEEDLCIGCGKCAADCVANNIKIEQKKAKIKSDCLLCGHCVAICPRNAVAIPEFDMEDIESCENGINSLNPDSLLHAIKSRRSIRQYKPLPVEQEKLKKLLQAGRYTATAKNCQDCRFVFIQDKLPVFKKIVWEYIDSIGRTERTRELLPYIMFNRRRKKQPDDDFLFRNAPAVLFIASDSPINAGLASQNMELMAVSLGLGVLHNGYLSHIVDSCCELKRWLGVEQQTIQTCLLLGYPSVTYKRTTPKKSASVIWK